MDKIFEMGLLVLGIGYLVYCYYSLTPQNVPQEGRYQYRKVGNQIGIFDTSKGTLSVYYSKEKGIATLNPFTGTLTMKPVFANSDIVNPLGLTPEEIENLEEK